MNLTAGERHLLRLMEQSDLQQFTVTQLHECYIAENASEDTSPKSTRQFVYRNLIKLEKSGLVTQLEGKKGRAIHYKYCKKRTEENKAEKSCGDEGFINSIRHNLKQCKLDFLTYTGEAEALKKLTPEGHSFSDLLGRKYNEALDNSAKKLGEVRVLEGLLREIEAPSV